MSHIPTPLVAGLFLIASGVLLPAQVTTDARVLPRDYRPTGPLRPVPPGIFPATAVPYEELDAHTRRKVFFDDRITFVILEVTRPAGELLPDGPIETHYHPHDQISHVLEGRLRVRVEDRVGELGPGGTYVVPSNVHHGIQVLSSKLVLLDMFTPTREDFRPLPEVPLHREARWTAAQLELFVRDWFRGFDENVPVEHFLDRLMDGGLEMRFPEATLRSHRAFRIWYAGILRTVARAHHDLRQVRITARDATTYEVDLEVLWEATTTSGVALRFLAHQVWELRDTGEPMPRIARYRVEAARE